MSRDIENIFKVGVEASGESLIGYQYHLDYIVNSFMNSKKNLSITGVKRIGKTSLAKESMRILKNKDANRFFVIDVDLARCDDYLMFLQTIVNKIKRTIRRDNALAQNDEIQSSLEDCLDDMNEKRNLKSSLEYLLQDINHAGKTIILLIDEFDAATEIFTNTSDFEYLRNLSSNSDMNLSLLLVSRRQVYMIEKRNVNNSTFHGIITTYPINGFNSKDLEAFWDKLHHAYGIDLPVDLKERISYYAGNSPYIWSMFGSAIVEMYDDEVGLDIDSLFSKHYIDIKDHCKAIYQNLSSDMIQSEEHSRTSIEKIVEILYGPNFDISRSDIEVLKELGYLSVDKNGRYYSISQYFTDYLRGKKLKLSGSFFESIIQTEKAVKRIIDFELAKICEENDIHAQSVKELQGKMLLKLNILDSGRLSVHDASIKSNKALFNQDSTFLDVISLKDSFKIIEKKWNTIFSKYFNESDIKSWKDKFELCAKARNPVAHGHEEFLTSKERKDVELICKEICDSLAGYEMGSDVQRVNELQKYIVAEKVEYESPVEQLLFSSVRMHINEVSGKNFCNLKGTINDRYLAVIPRNNLVGKKLNDYLDQDVIVRVMKIQNGIYEVELTE